jgi:hypothetical protein
VEADQPRTVCVLALHQRLVRRHERPATILSVQQSKKLSQQAVLLMPRMRHARRSKPARKGCGQSVELTRDDRVAQGVQQHMLWRVVSLALSLTSLEVKRVTCRCLQRYRQSVSWQMTQRATNQQYK